LIKYFLSAIVLLMSGLFIIPCLGEVEVVEAKPVALLAQEYVETVGDTANAAIQQNFSGTSNPALQDDALTDVQPMMHLLETIKLNTDDNDQQQIAEARDALFQNQPREALQKLGSVKSLSSQSKEVQAAYFITAVNAHERSHHLAPALMARMQLNEVLEDPSLQALNQNILWRRLQAFPINSLNQLLAQANSPLSRGWLQLASVVVANSNDNSELPGAIHTFRENNPDHPASRVLPDQTALDAVAHMEAPKKIALLLPLSKDFGKMGQAVRDGFMTAFYMQSKKFASLPKIKVYDTTAFADIASAYQQAVQEGSDFVVGPLTKEDVMNLAKGGPLTVPTLALNYLPGGVSAPANLIQFGLLPEQAAEQAADEAWSLGCHRVLVMVADSDWSKNIAQVFSDRFQQLGGQIIDAYTFETKPFNPDGIASILHVTQSEDRLARLKQLFKKEIKSVPHRRQDMDGIFLIAMPPEARQVYPLLNFYYAGNIPTLSISSIYDGEAVPERDRDLDGIYFDDMPWVLGDSPVKQQVASLWKNSYRENSRLYALGVDAFTLSIMLPRLMAMPNIAVSGVTGQLYLAGNQSIYRQLSWARFKEGIPQLETQA
jgi:hypothetical protein